jgi:hypothetical protein
MKNSMGLFLLFTLTTLLFSGCSDNKCISCYGTGNADCMTCSGTGKVNCSYCNGQGEKTCSACSGSGKEYRYDYGYDYANGGQYHYYYDRFPCKKCNQTGEIKCSNYSCEDGKVKCSNYSCEDGKVKCMMCNATGYEESGFFSGMKDGFLIIFCLIGKIFNSNIHLYASNTSGLFYWVGFVFGILLLGAVGSRSS